MLEQRFASMALLRVRVLGTGGAVNVQTVMDLYQRFQRVTR